MKCLVLNVIFIIQNPDYFSINLLAYLTLTFPKIFNSRDTCY